MLNVIRILSFLSLMLFFTIGVYSQDVDEVVVRPQHKQSVQQMNHDKNECYSYTDNQLGHSKHKTLKNTGVGIGVGAITGKILGSGSIGAIVGGGAGAYRGHKKSEKNEYEFQDMYAACLRDKGYSAEIR